MRPNAAGFPYGLGIGVKAKSIIETGKREEPLKVALDPKGGGKAGKVKQIRIAAKDGEEVSDNAVSIRATSHRRGTTG